MPAQFQGNTPTISSEVDHLLNTDLTDTFLDAHNFLHPAQPNPFNTLAINTAGFKSFLDQVDLKVNLLTVLMQEGIDPACQMGRRGAGAADVFAALQQVDSLYGQSPTLSEIQARTNIKQILTTLNNKIPVAAGAQPSTVTFGAPLSFDRLLTEISELNVLVWSVAGFLTALVGLVVLILNNPGFGISLDYVYCIFWGFGLPTAVQQLTASSAFYMVGISVPKS